jgi:hypothetical protein
LPIADGVSAPPRLNVRYLTQQRNFLHENETVCWRWPPKGLLAKGAVLMENNCAIDQAELEKLSYEFPDDALEISAIAGGERTDKITLYYCTALYFCPAP